LPVGTIWAVVVASAIGTPRNMYAGKERDMRSERRLVFAMSFFRCVATVPIGKGGRKMSGIYTPVPG